MGDEEREVAVKSLADDSKEEKRVTFLREAAVMGQFDHPAILSLYGVSTVPKPVSFTDMGRSALGGSCASDMGYWTVFGADSSKCIMVIVTLTKYVYTFIHI